MNESGLAEFRADFSRRHRVRWQEADASGFVHVSSYIRMMEETEYAFLRSHGVSVVMRDRHGMMGLPRVAAEIQVHQPAVPGDHLEIQLQITANDGVRIDYRFQVFRHSDRVATGTFSVVCCRFPADKPPRAILIPEFLMDILLPR